MFRILNGLDDVDHTSWFKYFSDFHEIPTRSSTSQHLITQRNRLDMRKNFFSQRVVDVWNGISLHVKSSESVNTFKKRYDEELLIEAE